MTIKRGVLVECCPVCFAVGYHEEDCTNDPTDLPFDAPIEPHNPNTKEAFLRSMAITRDPGGIGEDT